MRSKNKLGGEHMPQNRESGRRAYDYGHKTAPLIAKKIGAIPINEKKSNEFILNKQLVTIRCARKGNPLVGVLYSMLERVDWVIAAFEKVKNEYDLFQMNPTIYLKHSRDSKKQGKVGLVSRKLFEELGKPICSVRI
jgi:hypothetical protein